MNTDLNSKPVRLVYKVVGSIPKGSVTTYGNISKLVQKINPGIIVYPRYVGYLLHKNPDPENIPCHRVVNGNGKLAENFAFGGWREQKNKLTREGVAFRDEKHVDFEAILR